MKTTKKYALLLLLLPLLSALSSCSDTDPYFESPLCGNWQLELVNGYAVPELDVSEFQFYSDGTGTFGQYNQNGGWSTYPITWYTDFVGVTNYLYIDTWGGGTWIYQFKVYYDSLVLYDTLTGNTLTYTPY